MLKTYDITNINNAQITHTNALKRQKPQNKREVRIKKKIGRKKQRRLKHVCVLKRILSSIPEKIMQIRQNPSPKREFFV